ncbi:hypothetical protein BC828DRAFT_415743 [Blastocladiella britannica]|nr:hypothetical protein BC828DRAFT_415743 [Blastocladiella britannica]
MNTHLLADLPDDVLVQILLCLPPPSLVAFAATCHAIHSLTAEPEFWEMLATSIGASDEDTVPESNDAPYPLDVAPLPPNASRVDTIRHKVAFWTRPTRYAAWDFTGAHCRSQYIRDRDDDQASAGRVLSIDVWWLDIGTNFILSNGDWELFMDMKFEYPSPIEQVRWVIDQYPVDVASEVPLVPSTSCMLVRSLEQRQQQFESIGFSTVPGSESSPIRVRSKSGWARVQVRLVDTDSGTYKSGIHIDQVRAVRVHPSAGTLPAATATATVREVVDDEGSSQPRLPRILAAAGAAASLAVIGASALVLGSSLT